ncbi:MAG: DUF4845 domain-containing protein [Aquisalimonadaceae bacterium]
MIAFNSQASFQRGIGAPGLLLILTLLGSIALVGVRLWPVYVESFEVSSILSALEGEMSGRNASRSDLRQAIERRFQVNNITRVRRDQVTFAASQGGTEIVIAYEVRIPLIANLDLVAHFRKEALIRQ